MITHAGHGSIVKALAAGVPMVTMPFGRDQLDIAARAAYKGAAVKISPKAKPEQDRGRGAHGPRRRLLPRGRAGGGADDRGGERAATPPPTRSSSSPGRRAPPAAAAIAC